MSSMSAVALIISFFGSVILTRTVGPEGRGIIAWFIASASLTAIFMQFGLETVNRKYISSNPDLAGNLKYLSRKSISFAYLLMAPMYILFCFVSEVGKENLVMLFASTICIYFMAICPPYGGVLLGLHKIVPVALSGVILKSVNTGLIILLSTTSVLTPESALMSLLISYVFSFAILSSSLRIYKRNEQYDWRESVKTVRKYASINYLVLIFSIALISSFPLLLNHLSSAEEAGLFAACYIITDAITKVMGNISHYALPKISSIDSDRESLEFRNGLLLFMSVSISLAALFWFFISDYAIIFLFGDDFASATPTFNTLLIAMIFTTVGSTIYSFILSMRNDYYVVLPPLVGLVVTLVFSVIYIPFYGALGGAVAFSIGSFFSLLTSIILYRKCC